MPAGDKRDPLQQQRGIEFRNASGLLIPSFGVLQITGSEIAGVGRNILTVTRPDGTAGAVYAINGLIPIAVGQKGRCTLDFPTLAAYDTGDGTPAIGQFWGPKSGQFTLAKGMPGFSISGTAANERVFVTLETGGIIIGKTDASHAKSATGTISVYSDTSTDTGVNITATNLFADLESGKWVSVALINGVWYLIAGEC